MCAYCICVHVSMGQSVCVCARAHVCVCKIVPTTHEKNEEMLMCVLSFYGWT